MKLLLATVVALALAGIPAPTTASSTVGKNWQTVTTFKQSKGQLCRDFRADGDYVLKLRMDNRQGKRASRAIVKMNLDGIPLVPQKTRFVKPGRVSKPQIVGGFAQGANYRARVIVKWRSGAKRKDSIRLSNIRAC